MLDHADNTDLDTLARRFEHFVHHEQSQSDSSPLYQQLSLRIAADREILALVAHARSQPANLLLLAAVHFLLLQGTQHQLAAFYPSLSLGVEGEGEVYPHFRSFCAEHRAAIQQILETRRLQTNEVRRCACLLPVFALIARHAGNRPLALIEIGASAGLNLLWDRYSYSYGNGLHFGKPASAVQLSCEVRGDLRPPFPTEFPSIASRIGVDLDPVNVQDPEATLWLRACIWPEQQDRALRLEQAIQVARQEPPTLIKGDALDRLSEILPTLSPDWAVCVFHSYTVNQFSPQARERLTQILAKHAMTRQLFEVSLEWLRGEYPLLEVISFRDGVESRRLVAHCHTHGEWIEWLAGEEG